MSAPAGPLSALREASSRTAFNRSLGLVIESAGAAEVKLRLLWRADLGQYSGYLHAGVIVDSSTARAASPAAR